MLQGAPDGMDLIAERDRLLEERAALDPDHELPGSAPENAAVTTIHYPVKRYPEKIKSHNFDKRAIVEGTLEGIKGQYLIFDTGVINLRKFGGYEVDLTTG